MELESVMEQNLISQLTTGVSQWTYRDDIKNESALWQNIRDKLNQNNKKVLQGVEITDAEFEQIKNFLLDQAATTYKAALFFAGENGEAIIPLVRENAKFGTVHLMAVSNREIAGGRSSYEVINQFVVGKISADDRTRRFDVTLLINGFPMIHIELKNRTHSYLDAFRQIKKYSVQGKFRGLFGFLQMFVVSNGTDTRYIAADYGDNLREKFLTVWVDENNKNVDDYLNFAKAVLKIPDAHNLVGNYSVIDTEQKKLILLRPYQIHAIEAVKNASREQQSGFVWHTTGSGKTLTSYTVTKNLLQIPSIDKTIFLVDRKALDEQTSLAFKSYAENDFIDVDNTENTFELLKKLKSSDRIAIVTTIQKLQRIIKSDNLSATTEKKLRNLHLAFIVDECHRTVTPEVHREINKFFNGCLWYGFTGTPIFEENKREQKGDLAQTTFELFGECLHKYTIKEALKNNSVLGFQIDYFGNSADEKIDCNSEKYILKVIDAILNKSAGKFKLNAPRGESYEAILTVDSIPKAAKYYKLMKKFIAEEKISDAVKSKLNDFPKIAITFTVTENAENSIEIQKIMSEALQDYNKLFNTTYTMSELNAYNTNLIERLARKSTKYKRRENQLDLVIVVDRLLTGFDSPSLAILFIDRPPFKPQHIVQAFSRTNRIFDKSKRYGRIVIFQQADDYKIKVDDALRLYSNGGTNEVSAPTFETTEEKFVKSIKNLREIAPSPEKVNNLSEIEEKKKFAKAFQKLDRFLSEIQVYQDWEDKILEDYGITAEEIENYSGKYQSVLEELRKDKGGGNEETFFDAEYELEILRSETIDYYYIIALIQKYVPDEDEIIVEQIEDKKIDSSIETLKKTNSDLADVVFDVWNDLKKSPANYRGLNIANVIEDNINKIIDKKISALADEWHLDKKQIYFFLNNFSDTQLGNLNSDFDAYKKTHDISKIQYRKAVKKVVQDLINDLHNLVKV